MSRAPAKVVHMPKRKANATLQAEAQANILSMSSAIESTHKAYKLRESQWRKTRLFLDGTVEGVIEFIRSLPGHDKDERDLFKKMAYFLPAVARTQEAFAGMIMNPEPVISAPEELSAYLLDVTNDGEPIKRMIARTVVEVVGVSRCAILVDFPRVEATGTELSVAEAEAAGLRAYARFYKAEDILDWRMGTFGGQRYLDMIKLRESYTERKDEWTTIERKQIRVLDFAPMVEGGKEEFYRVRVFRQGEGGWALVGEPFFPTANGENMDEIPCVVFGPDSLDPTEVAKPVLYDMVQISESHLNNSALLEWALMWVGNPTVVFRGLMTTKDDRGNTNPIRLGSSAGIVTSEEGGADILFLPAEGVGAIRQTMEDKRRDMAAVGARLLADETSGQIARDTAVIQRAGEHSVLAGIADTVGDGWTRVLKLIAVWAGVEVDEDAVDEEQGSAIDIKLNTDYVPLGLEAGELTALISAVQGGTLSMRDLFTLLQKRNVIRADKTFEEHQEEVEDDDQRLIDNPRADIFSANDPAIAAGLKEEDEDEPPATKAKKKPKKKAE